MASDHTTTGWCATGMQARNHPPAAPLDLWPPFAVPPIPPLKRTSDEIDLDVASYPILSGHEFRLANFPSDEEAGVHRPKHLCTRLTGASSFPSVKDRAAFRNSALEEYLQLQWHKPVKYHSARLLAAVKRCWHTGEAVMTLHVSPLTRKRLTPNYLLTSSLARRNFRCIQEPATTAFVSAP